jgi:hypothetical protein
LVVDTVGAQAGVQAIAPTWLNGHDRSELVNQNQHLNLQFTPATRSRVVG